MAPACECRGCLNKQSDYGDRRAGGHRARGRGMAGAQAAGGNALLVPPDFSAQSPAEARRSFSRKGHGGGGRVSGTRQRNRRARLGLGTPKRHLPGWHWVRRRDVQPHGGGSRRGQEDLPCGSPGEQRRM